MSKILMRRFERLETGGTKGLGYLHIIYARDGVDFEAQRSTLLANGGAKATDTFMDWNYGLVRICGI